MCCPKCLLGKSFFRQGQVIPQNQKFSFPEDLLLKNLLWLTRPVKVCSNQSKTLKLRMIRIIRCSWLPTNSKYLNKILKNLCASFHIN